ncbi:MAG TPA: response regulator [Verrucomicrobiae bacterium]|nr:response regulator [Verrucomicrobiae bacterium]
MTRVLIVDDKEDNLYYLQALLGGHGFAVEAARHGAEALVKARQNPPDVAISDLLMPVMDGYTLLRHWKADPRLKQIPFIVYTATYTEPEDERLALSLGADAFILKPAEPDAFLARLREVQDRPTAPRPAAPTPAPGDEKELLKNYSETLIRKLEEKTLQLEESNRALQQDIAGRQAAEERLRESEERFRATFEQAAVGISHVDLDGRLLRVNDKLCEITGYTREELLERTFLDLSASETQAESDAARRAMLAGRQHTFTTEKRYQRKNGSNVWVNVVISLLRDETGAPKYFIAVTADITERKILEEHFLRTQRMESIGTLAGGIAHDLNNVLAPIMMSVQMLQTKVTDEEGRSLLRTLQSCAQRGADLVRQVLSFARGMEGQRVAVNLRHIGQDIQKIIRETFPKQIEFTLHTGRDLWPVPGDPTQLHQVLMNLCVNARDAMPDGGRLTVTLENVVLDEVYAGMHPEGKPGPYVMVKVADTGIGIPPEIRDKIFEPFFTTKPLGNGTGLGLSTTLTIVKSHNGFINLYSEPGNGTKFKVYFPIEGTTPVADPTPTDKAGPPHGKGETVLVVDDEENIRRVAQSTLERFGYQVLVAANGAEAVSLYAKHRAKVALVLTDMAMPVMDGPATITALRAINPTVAIVGSSGLADNAVVARAMNNGICHFVAKPYTAEALLQKIHDVLQETGPR